MATPVPPPSPRHLRLLRLLLSGLVLGAALRGAAARRPDAAVCPGSLDCALKRRARCPPGARVCGPCLQPFQEDPQGLCVPRLRQPQGEGLPQPRLEDEIDFLAQELARQEAGHSRLTAPPQPEGRLRLLEAASTLGLSERGRGPNLGLASTRGAPTPRTTSLRSTVSSGPVHMSPLEPRGGRGDGLALRKSGRAGRQGPARKAALTAPPPCSADRGVLRGRRGRPCRGRSLLVSVSMGPGWGRAAGRLGGDPAGLRCGVSTPRRLQRDVRLTQKADYAAPQAPSSPATPRISPGDQRLAHSAEMYHYQHQRQQMRCLERHKEPPKELDSASSDEENEDGDFTVYECPGLAPVSAGVGGGCPSPALDPPNASVRRLERWRCGTHCSTTPRCPRPRCSDPKADAHPLVDALPTGGEGQAPAFPIKETVS
ncbi:neural proliferation differentiation and control protein 1 isoform X2 [Monodon monoceros]|uniref:neural proliferation differentiation and control protein 1 isoform X2 n=1 Tax=Monodon monoceros TaxID=40151 RepID=UPI0010F852A0|nr:neural proliferation differentiation and control protein 1 isoform X2 [Monodon monoceros]